MVRKSPRIVNATIGASDKDGKQMATTLLGLLLRLNFITKLEAAQVASFPEYWWIVHEVVRQGGDVDIDLGSGITPLHVAMRYRLYSLAQSMLENGAWPNAREYSGSTPLTYALVTSNECMVMLSRCLVDENGKGRDSKKHTMDGMFLLDEWARISTTANGLLASRRLLDVSERPKGEPLSSVVVLQRDVRQAVNEWNTAFMKLMLQEGGEWDALDASTNLHRSAVYGNAGGVDLLLANNVDPFVLDPLHRLPFHVASCRGNRQVVDVLSSYVNDSVQAMLAPDLFGTTPSQLSSVTKKLKRRMIAPHQSVQSGGWSDAEALELGIDHCDIKQVDGRKITADRFIREFVLKSQPVVLRGAALDWKFRTDWTKALLNTRLGDTPTHAGPIPYAADVSRSYRNKQATTLAAFIEAMPEQARNANRTIPDYVVSASVLKRTDWSHVRESVPLPPPFLQGKNQLLHNSMKQHILDQETILQFYLGPAYSGSPFQFREDAWDALAFGKKRWFLTSPDSSVYSASPAYEFFKHDFDELTRERDIFQCVQNPGDVMYIPNMWSHMVLHLKESVGIDVEFKVGYWQ